MTIKFKTFGAVVLAAMVLSNLAAASASATTGGHFTSDVAHTSLQGSEVEGTGHTTKISFSGWGTVECVNASYSGTISATTVTDVTITPTYSTCKTTGQAHNVTVDVNGCDFKFKIGQKAGTDNTVELACPSGKILEITHPNCTIKIPPQILEGGAAYTAVTVSAKAALTVDLTGGMTAHFEGGICIFLGTNHPANQTGAVVISGKDTEGSNVSIRATGSEEEKFHSEVSHTAVTGVQTGGSKMTFGVLLGTVECSTATLDGTMNATVLSEVTVKPAYGGCVGTGREVTTHTNGCAYILTIGESTTSGQVDIECPEGKAIETTIDKFPEGCTLTIGAQTAGGVVDYKEEGSGTGRDLLLTWTLEGLHYTRDGCEVGGTGNNGTMSGSITLSGEDTSGNPKGIWIE